MASRLAQEPGPSEHPGDIARQVARHGPCGRVRPRCDPGPRRQRLLERVSRRAVPAQLEGGGDLRGHEPAPHVDPGRLRPRIPRGPAVALRARAGRWVPASGRRAGVTVKEGSDAAPALRPRPIESAPPVGWSPKELATLAAIA